MWDREYMMDGVIMQSTMTLTIVQEEGDGVEEDGVSPLAGLFFAGSIACFNTT